MARRKKATLQGVDVDAHIAVEKELKLDNDNQNKLDLKGLKAIESVDIDKYFAETEANATRWDYYIGLQKHGEIYVEVHKVNDEEVGKLLRKAAWLEEKIDTLGWPRTDGRPFLIAPTSGIPLFAVGTLKKQLALKKLLVVMKNDSIKDVIT